MYTQINNTNLILTEGVVETIKAINHNVSAEILSIVKMAESIVREDFMLQSIAFWTFTTEPDKNKTWLTGTLTRDVDDVAFSHKIIINAVIEPIDIMFYAYLVNADGYVRKTGENILLILPSEY